MSRPVDGAAAARGRDWRPRHRWPPPCDQQFHWSGEPRTGRGRRVLGEIPRAVTTEVRPGRVDRCSSGGPVRSGPVRDEDARRVARVPQGCPENGASTTGLAQNAIRGEPPAPGRSDRWETKRAIIGPQAEKSERSDRQQEVFRRPPGAMKARSAVHQRSRGREELACLQPRFQAREDHRPAAVELAARAVPELVVGDQEPA
jgi:hypothetical protein